MATVVQLPRDPSLGSAIGELAGFFVARKMGQARAVQKSRENIESFNQMFPEEAFSPEETIRLSETGEFADFDEAANTLLELRRAREVMAPVTQTDEEGTRTFERPVSRAEIREGRLSDKARAKGQRLGTPVKGGDRVTFFARDPNLQPLGVGTEEQRATGELPQDAVTFQEWKALYGGDRASKGETFYADQKDLERVAFGTEEERAAGAFDGLTFEEHKAKYGSTSAPTDTEKALRRAVTSRGLPLNKVTLNAARIEVKEAGDIQRQIRENYGERFGETFSFGSDQRRQLNNRANEIWDDVLWEAASKGESLTQTEVASAAMAIAEEQLGPPDQKDPEEQLANLEDAQAAATASPTGPSPIKDPLDFFFGKEPQKQEDPLETGKTKLDTISDESFAQVKTLMRNRQYRRTTEFLIKEGFSETEARAIVLDMIEDAGG